MGQWEAVLLLLLVALYASAAICFSLRYIFVNQRLIVAGTAFSAIALLLHSLLLMIRSIAAGRLPFSNLYEFTLVFAWATLILFVFCAIRFRLMASGPIALTLTTILVGIAALMPRDIRPLMPALRSGWLQSHVLSGVIAYGALAISAILAVVMLTRSTDRQQDQGGGWTAYYWRIPDRTSLERTIHNFMVIGFIFLTALLVTGSIWAEETWGRWWGWDPKEVWALITWLIYLVYLHGRSRFGWRGRTVALFSAIGFVAVLFTLFGVTYLLPGLHSYK